jgi:hypothetical protein
VEVKRQALVAKIFREAATEVPHRHFSTIWIKCNVTEPPLSQQTKIQNESEK